MKTVITLGDMERRGMRMREVACRRCERRGRLRLDKLIARHGPALPLPELRVLLAGDCPKSRSVSMYDKCTTSRSCGAVLTQHSGRQPGPEV